MLWAHFLVITLGLWLLTSPFQFALFDPAAAGTVRDVTQERGLWEPSLRNAITGWSDIGSGMLLMLFGALSLSPRFSWAQWGTTLVGLWLLFAPLFFWTPSAAGFMNDMLVGALAITFSVLVPMIPGMTHDGMMDESTVPPGWNLLTILMAAAPADHCARLLRLSHRPLSHCLPAWSRQRRLGAVLLGRRR